MQAKKRVWTWLIVLVGAGFAVQTGANVWRLWKLGSKVSEAQKTVEEAEAENKELAARLEYVKSPEFIEKEARDKLGYGREGETIVVIPDQGERESGRVEESTKIPNWRKWWKLYITN